MLTASFLSTRCMTVGAETEEREEEEPTIMPSLFCTTYQVLQPSGALNEVPLA